MNGSSSHSRCVEKVAEACGNDKSIKFMLQQLRKFGCDISLANQKLLCEPCDTKILGGFDPDRKEIVVNETNVASQKELKRVLTHELIHAYDVCRRKYDVENLRHLACSEIRAANLSGDCSFLREWLLHFRIKGQRQRCVKRRAVESILCVKPISHDQAERIVDSVFNDCFNDTAPFNDMPS